jgi:hypothetical protein
MNTTPAPTLAAFALKTAALYQRLSNIAALPALDGWDIIDTDCDGVIYGHLIQLFPRRDELRYGGFVIAAPVARLFPGQWTKVDDGAWFCKCTGELAGLRIHIHYVERVAVKDEVPANVIDLSAVA